MNINGDIKNIQGLLNASSIVGEDDLDFVIDELSVSDINPDLLTANEIAKEAEFFSFGTNDLTQLTYGFSRDDASKFLNEYYKIGLFENDPFAKLDQNGVGLLVKTAIKEGKKARHDIELGICGEHGGEPSSIEFCHNVGLNYVSCSPYRVPIARLAAAQARAKELLEEE